jgi:7,8-dihydropterin-6-yl-methyl-4-(beta-D-ribofuranosyl)aminobenzene 5'-phosphate synthase
MRTKFCSMIGLQRLAYVATTIFRSFLFLVIGVTFCACTAAITTERTQVFPTPVPSLPQEITQVFPAPLPSLPHETPFPAVQTATLFPLPSQTPRERKIPTLTPPDDVLRISIVYDNNPFNPNLKTAWGFSALVEYRDQVVLFDTGGDGQILLENMQTLGIDVGRIQSIVLSHGHEDHTGGLSAILDSGVQPPVYLLASFSDIYKRQVRLLTQVIEVTPGQFIGDGILTTGEIAINTPEQALVIRSGEGLVVITGCAHPGIVRIVERAIELTSDPVYLVLGGFHLDSKSESEISTILADFRRLGVQKVAPCHCTGERAITMFAAEYGEAFIQAGVGTVVTLNK